jgi:tRNA-modifying protein YgfZ
MNQFAKHFSLPETTTLLIRGKERQKWLNNLITNDLRRVSQGQVIEAFITDVKGRTLSHGVFFEDHEAIVFLSWGLEQAEKLLAHFDRYIIREDVAVENVTERFHWHAFEATGDLTANSWSHPALGAGWRIAYRPNEMGWDEWINPLDFKLGEELSKESVEWLRIGNRWPIIGLDFNEKNLPQELDRNEQAISFTKGCYLGQETVARLDALGQVQKKLCRLSLVSSSRIFELFKVNSPQRTDLDLTLTKDGKEAGFLTSIAVDPASKTIRALGMVRRGYFSSGTELESMDEKIVVIA